MDAIAPRVDRVVDAFEPIARFFSESRWRKRLGTPEACDFAFGNPQEMPIPGLVAALSNHVQPQNKDWYAYKGNEAEPCEVVAESLSDRLGRPFEPADIAMTNGGFGAIATALRLVCEDGAEVVFSIPSWFCYESMVRLADLVPVKVPLAMPAFDLDLDAIAAAIGPKTRMVVVNSPHNPTGRIYARGDLERLADLLAEASRRYGRPIWLLSDEAYREIVFAGATFTSPATAYPWTLIAYSYAKKLLAPGQRIGYLAVASDCPQRVAVRERFIYAQMAAGWLFPNALMQYSIRELEDLSIDIAAMQRRRDTMVAGLRDAGYAVTVPEGTFYIMAQAPVADDRAFCDRLAERDVYVLPGSMCDMPGYFRISLTANDDMVRRALPVFREAVAAPVPVG